jgi:ABC-2 type transport system permease protein
MNVVLSITMLSIVLTGAALIREREHGTIEHLLAMPVTARAGEFPGLVELVLTIMGLAALLLGALTEWVLAVFQERRARWYRGLAYAVIWFLLISMWLWLRSR